MLTMSLGEWSQYRDLLKKLSDQAADEFRDAVWKAGGKFGAVGLGKIPREELIEFAYALVTKYGEGAAAAACEWYDAIAQISGAAVKPAEPAATPAIDEVAKAVNGTMKTGNTDTVADALGRLVKRTGQDTTLQNSIRDGAQVAWITQGDTCAFCITLASRGWEYASNKLIDKGHAKHIHARCDCFYGVRFNSETEYEGYDPQSYLDVYNAAQGADSQAKINDIRRELYKQNKDEINAQKREAYARRKERETEKES